MSYTKQKNQLIGYVAADPVISGEDKQPFAAIRLVTNERYKKEDEYHDIPSWHSLVFFGRLADFAKEYVKKGQKLFIEGKSKYTAFEGKDGITRQACEIVVQEIHILSSRKTENEVKVGIDGGLAES